MTFSASSVLAFRLASCWLEESSGAGEMPSLVYMFLSMLYTLGKFLLAFCLTGSGDNLLCGGGALGALAGGGGSPSLS